MGIRETRLCTCCETEAVYFEPIMQYTGLLDKNGKEIYEGDILRVREEEGGAWYEPEIWAVKYSERSYDYRCYNPKKYGDTEYWPLHKFQRFEVIGNIYESPELLGGKQ